ncbi:MAG: MFS transporter [Actinomycetota bacterium]
MGDSDMSTTANDQPTAGTGNGTGAAPDDGPALPRSVVLGLAAGYLGMSTLLNLINTLLVFFYLPPDTAGLPSLVSDATVLGILNVVALIAAAGRFTDAVTDPLIASRSDSSTHRRGRRIPFMAAGMVPAAIATWLMFVPPVERESGWNIVWLLGVQVVLYVALTAYVTPAFALVADLGRSPMERLRLSTWTSLAWALGLVIAAFTLFTAGLLEESLGTYRAWQAAAGITCAIGLVFMIVPVLTLDEPRWASAHEPSTMPLIPAVRFVLGNRFFRFYAAADFAYFGGLALIQTGLLFYITVLVELEEWVSTVLLLAMVVVSIFLFPVVSALGRRLRGGKRLTIVAFCIGAGVFSTISVLGLADSLPYVQVVIPVLIFAVPFAILSIMPQWILADIAEHSTLETGQSQAAMFYATRTFLQKLSTTAGVVVFALLLQFGRDVGDDLGVRLTGVTGAVLYLVAAWFFSRYDEHRLQSELAAARHDIGAPVGR